MRFVEKICVAAFCAAVVVLAVVAVLAPLLAESGQAEKSEIEKVLERHDIIPILFYDVNKTRCCMIHNSTSFQCWNSSFLFCIMQVGKQWVVSWNATD